VSVKRTNYGLGWSYTLGVFDTSGKPEIITIGLQPETAHFALNEAAKLLRTGVDLTKGRHGDLVGEVECEFRPVDPKWIRHLMGWAVWYYEGTDFPVLQAVYPDLENRFPEDEGFDTAFEQPLMQPTAPMTRAENDFWASADPKSSLFNWKFTDPPHIQAFLSETVHNGTEHVTYVSHDAEEAHSDFQLIAGTNRDLFAAVRQGRFREDLLSRINLWTFSLPGLKHRVEDIEPNLDFELDRFAEKAGRRVTFSKEARERFLDFALSPAAIWIGNFRDLNAAVARMATLASGGRISTHLVDEETNRLTAAWHTPRQSAARRCS
jgi:uncharacterized protein DUF4262/sigma-54 interacting transcriptional regulator